MASKPTPLAPLVLASASPRRARLLRDAGYRFQIVRPPLDEPQDIDPGLTPSAHAEALSFFKARSVQSIASGAVIIAADTLVADRHRTYGKPADRDRARVILGHLAGTTHRVITGLTVLDTRSDVRLISHCVSRVTMKPMTPVQLERYLDSDQWKGKAGAYGIQDVADAFVERIEGSYTNVVGLPMELLPQLLEQCANAPQPIP